MESKKLRVLLLDVETSPIQSFIWSLWKEIGNFNFVDVDWYILCFAAQWLGEKKITTSALIDFPEYKKNSENDKPLLLKLWKLLDEADVVVAHNGIQFDRCKINSRFIINGINPPSPYRMIDTLAAARKDFAFTSNRLNDLGQMLGVGGKLDTGGFNLWKGCLAGDKQAWKKMVEYNKRDIVLLEKIYLKLRPYMATHPNINIDAGMEEACCPKCGSDNIHFRGYSYTNFSKFRKFCCQDCGGWGRSKLNELTKLERTSLQVSA